MPAWLSKQIWGRLCIVLQNHDSSILMIQIQIPEHTEEYFFYILSNLSKAATLGKDWNSQCLWSQEGYLYLIKVSNIMTVSRCLHGVDCIFSTFFVFISYILKTLMKWSASQSAYLTYWHIVAMPYYYVLNKVRKITLKNEFNWVVPHVV